MSLFQSANPKEEHHSGILGAFSVDNIKWEPGDDAGASLVAFRYPYEDFPNGSYLQVDQSQIAVFTNNLTAGDSMNQDGSGASQVSVFIGPCKIKLDTGDSRFAPFRNVTHALTGGSSAFHSVVYFISSTYMNELRWGTQSPIIVEDPVEGVNVHVRAYGLFGAHLDQEDAGQAVVDARKFLMKVVGTRSQYSRQELTDFLRAKILERIPDLLGKAIIDKKIGILEMSSHYSEFSDQMKESLVKYFQDFGMTLDNFSFLSIQPLEEDLAAINEMKIQKKRQELEAEANARQMDIESEAIARKRQREGYSYHEERGMDVMQSAASNEGSASSAFLGAGMGLGMGVGVGGAVGAGFSNLARETVGNIESPAASQAAGNTVVCPECSHVNPAGAKFCLECGAKLETKIKCPSCGYMNPLGAKFCQECGTKLGGKLKCPKCGHELEPGAKFCNECGAKLTEEKKDE